MRDALATGISLMLQEPNRRRNGREGSTSRGSQPKFFELAIERGEAQAEATGRLALVVAALGDDALDVLTFVVADGGAEVVAVGVGLRFRDQAGREVVGRQD